MSRRGKSPNGRTSDRHLRGDDSTDDLRRYQECAKKLDECSKNLLRLCQVSGELNNLHDDEIERAANEIIRNEEEEAKKIAAELLHQKGLLHRNNQEPEVSTNSYVNQDNSSSRPRSGMSKSNTAARRVPMDYEVPKTSKNHPESSADQRSNVQQQIINQPPYHILHCEERIPYQPSSLQQQPGARPNPCSDYSSSQLKVPITSSSPYVTKGDGLERKGPPYFRGAQEQPASSRTRPEPVWNTPVNRKADSSVISNSWLVDQCEEQMKKNEMAQNCEPPKRVPKPQTIHVTAGSGRAADPPVHIVITAIANDSPCEHVVKQSQPTPPRDPLYSDNEFAEESVYSLGGKGPSTVYSTPTGDDRLPQKYIGSQQKLIDRGSDAYVCPDDVNPSNVNRPTYKEILDTILSQRPHDAESLLRSKGILNCAIKCWERTKNNLRAKSAQQANSRRDLQYCLTSQGRQEQTTYLNQAGMSNSWVQPRSNNVKYDCKPPNPSTSYSRNCLEELTKRDIPAGNRKNVILNCYDVPRSSSKTVQSRASNPAEMVDTFRQYRSPASPCQERQIPYKNQMFSNPSKRATPPPKTFRCTQICPPSSPARSPILNRTHSNARMKPSSSEMDSSILLAIAKAAINLSLENHRDEREDREYNDDCESGYTDIIDSLFDE